MESYLLVALGGALGSMARYGVATATASFSTSVPWGTIIINIVGSFVIGWFATLTGQDGRLPLSAETRLFVMTGICGGFTTFSAFSLQTFYLLRSDQWGAAAVNVGVSVTVCILAVIAGYWTATRLGLPPFHADR